MRLRVNFLTAPRWCMQNTSKIMPKMEHQGRRNVKNIGGNKPYVVRIIRSLKHFSLLFWAGEALDAQTRGCLDITLRCRTTKLLSQKRHYLAVFCISFYWQRGPAQKEEETTISKNIPLTAFCINRTANECYDFSIHFILKDSETLHRALCWYSTFYGCCPHFLIPHIFWSSWQAYKFFRNCWLANEQ